MLIKQCSPKNKKLPFSFSLHQVVHIQNDGGDSLQDCRILHYKMYIRMSFLYPEILDGNLVTLLWNPE